MNERELRLQKAAAADLPVMHALLVVCGEHLYRQTGLRHWYPFRTYEQWSQRLDTEQVYAVYAGDYLVGTFNLNPMPRPYYQDSLWHDPTAKAAYISGVGVLPPYQRQGIGHWMVAQAERLAAESGNAALRFDIVLADEALIRFCDGLGYARRGTISMAQWRLNDVLCYERVLTGS